MTTNTTKIAEAISLLSTVLSSEVAQINHPFDNEEETDSLEDYDDLKELAEDYANELNNDLEIARGEISNCLEWESADPLDQDFDEKMWDDDEDEDEPSEEETKEEETDEAKIIEAAKLAAESKIAELESSNEKMKAVLENVAENINNMIQVTEHQVENLESY